MKTGDKVVCIDDSNQDPTIPKVNAGEIYTISGARECPWPSRYNGAFFSLKEVTPGFFWHGLFRPVDDTFGEVVAEIIEKMVEVEEMETV